MSSENFFYNNRNNKKCKILFFKTWISSVYFSTLEALHKDKITNAAQ
jgi:hypothetical protein